LREGEKYKMRTAGLVSSRKDITCVERNSEMREQFVEIKTSEGVMDAFVTHPEDNGPFPAVILYMDIWGVREELYDIARRIGTVGYYCMVPDLYYRSGKRIHFEFRNEKNQTTSINRLEGEALRKIQGRPKLTARRSTLPVGVTRK
jgi:dienelactone hydrolase